MSQHHVRMTEPSRPSSRPSPVPEVIDELWERRTDLTPTDDEARRIVVEAVNLLDSGVAQVAAVDPANDDVVVDERARRAILLSFKVLGMEESQAGPFRYQDRVPLKQHFDRVRVVPGAIARWGSYLAPGVVLMPSYVNIGAHVGAGTLVDTWATVGSCAQIGSNVHLSGGVGIGGVLEPPGAAPVVVEDEAFVGSRSVIVEGARVRRGAKLGMRRAADGQHARVRRGDGRGTATRTGAVLVGLCQLDAAKRTFPGGEFGVPCLLVIKRLGEGEEHDRLLLDSLFREHGAAA